ncbi:MAG: NADH-quinone oxidoreductase subunit I [Elusimicrobiota bacterium]
MLDYFKEIGGMFWALLKGMRVTFATMLRPAITVQYPTEKLTPYSGYRGALLFDADKCISCNLCVKACPSACIFLENAKNETGKKIAKVEWYSIDFGKCNFCRLCEEACPTKPKSVWHAMDYELVFFRRDEMVRCWKKGFDFVGQYFDRAAKAFKKPEGQVQIQTVQERR